MQFSWRLSFIMAVSLLFAACESAEAAGGSLSRDDSRLRDWIEQYNEDFSSDNGLDYYIYLNDVSDQESYLAVSYIFTTRYDEVFGEYHDSMMGDYFKKKGTSDLGDFYSDTSDPRHYIYVRRSECRAREYVIVRFAEFLAPDARHALDRSLLAMADARFRYERGNLSAKEIRRLAGIRTFDSLFTDEIMDDTFPDDLRRSDGSHVQLLDAAVTHPFDLPLSMRFVGSDSGAFNYAVKAGGGRAYVRVLYLSGRGRGSGGTCELYQGRSHGSETICRVIYAPDYAYGGGGNYERVLQLSFPDGKRFRLSDVDLESLELNSDVRKFRIFLYEPLQPKREEGVYNVLIITVLSLAALLAAIRFISLMRLRRYLRTTHRITE